MMKELLEKILEVNKRVTCVDKGGRNTFSNYNYSRLGDILAPLRPILSELGLVITQSVTPLDNHVEEHGGKYYTVSSVSCKTTLTDVDTGYAITVESVGFSMDVQGDKAAYKATTGARKYGITMVFNLDWDAVEPEDDKWDDKRDTHTKAQQTVATSNKRSLLRR